MYVNHANPYPLSRQTCQVINSDRPTSLEVLPRFNKLFNYEANQPGNYLHIWLDFMWKLDSASLHLHFYIEQLSIASNDSVCTVHESSSLVPHWQHYWHPWDLRSFIPCCCSHVKRGSKRIKPGWGRSMFLLQFRVVSSFFCLPSDKEGEPTSERKTIL